MTRMRCPAWIAWLPCVLIGVAAHGEPGPVSLQSLLREMIDRDAMARWPEVPYVSKQASSYDRLSKTPKDEKGWFANVDNMDGAGASLKWETINGRRECVLMDVQGPGAVVRFWTGGALPKGKVRFYLDGSDTPALEGGLYDLLGGREFVPNPLAIENSGKATNLYLPVPYASRCKITYDEVNPKSPNGPPPRRWFNIEYRAYPAGTRVEPFTMERYKAAQELVAQVAKTLAGPEAFSGGTAVVIEKEIEPGQQVLADLPAGAAAVRQLTLKLDVEEGQIEQATRSMVLVANFDGEQAIWSPVGDFFGCGVGIHELRSWMRTVTKDGAMVCRWVMPYQKSGSLALLNTGTKKVKAKLEARVGPWAWDERSMHFHSTWRYQYPIPTRPFIDWNYVTVSGRGVYVGDTLALMNPANKWWGEGDEKVWVDGEDFPSHFGTGTEDYYGYAWGNPAIFQGPFCNQPSSTGDVGHRTNTRERGLDAIPFTKSLQFDMEVWHWAETRVAYGVATYWYAMPGATTTIKPDVASAGAPLPEPAPAIRGAIECERMKVLAKAEGVKLLPQTSYPFEQGTWSRNGQILVQARKPGDFVELLVAENVSGPRKLTIHGTRSYDYGIVRWIVNGRAAGEPWDGYAPKPVLSGPVELRMVEPKDGRIVLRVEVVDANPQAKAPKYFFGLDCAVLAAP